MPREGTERIRKLRTEDGIILEVSPNLEEDVGFSSQVLAEKIYGAITDNINKAVGAVSSFLRTALYGAYNFGERESLQDEFVQYRYVAILDSRTTDICRGLHNKLFEYGKGPEPPQHYNCRSEIRPVLRLLDRDREYRAFNSQRMREWMLNQPDETQDSIMGKRKAVLFRQGRYQPPAEWQSQRRYYADQGTRARRKLARTLNRRMKKLYTDFDPYYTRRLDYYIEGGRRTANVFRR